MNLFKCKHQWINISLLLTLALCPRAGAEDARARMQEQKEQVVNAAQAHRQAVQEEVAALRREIEHDRQGVKARLAQLDAEVNELERSRALLQRHMEQRRHELEAQKNTEAEQTRRYQELLGSIRTSAADAVNMVKNSAVTALDPLQDKPLRDHLASEAAPSVAELRTLRDVMLRQIVASAQVQRQTVEIVDREGRQVEADVVLLGAFTALYRTPAEAGFALYSPPSRQLLALSRLPDSTLRSAIEDYFAGRADAAPVDIGHGASLRQMTYQRNLQEQVRHGGFIVWPILAIGVVALLLVGERIWFLWRQRYNGEDVLTRLQPCIESGEWDRCGQECRKFNLPLARVLEAGLPFVHHPREELENVLQEAILAEIPPQERFLSTLAVLASIAPLLGLLGTVTGMIHTFELITFHGAGDPRMLSTGISEALVTTMFGLGVAIPVMLAHSMISRRVETHIAELEEKAISFVNRVTKSRLHGGGNTGAA